MSARFGPVRRGIAVLLVIACAVAAATVWKLDVSAHDDMRAFRAEVRDVLLMRYQRYAAVVEGDPLAIEVGETRRDLRSLYAEVRDLPEPARRDRITQWLQWDVLTVGGSMVRDSETAPAAGHAAPTANQMMPGVETRKVKVFRVAPDGTLSR